MSDKVHISSVFDMHYLIIHVVLYCFIALFYCIAHAQPLLFVLPVFPAVRRTNVPRVEYFYSTVEHMSDKVRVSSVCVCYVLSCSCFITLFYCVAHAQPLLFVLPVLLGLLLTPRGVFYSIVE